MAKSPLKQEWDGNGGKVTRPCRVCHKPFTAKAWNQTICIEEFCKKGSFLKSHFEASKRRWEAWQNDSKGKGINFN